MVVRFRAKFDGKVLVPQEPVELTANGEYEVAVENGIAPPPPAGDVPHVLTQIAALATDMGVTDLAEHHREYARRRKFGGKLPE
jgi:hypothetical protein